MDHLRYAYIGLAAQGRMELVVSREKLAPAGHRLTRNNLFPAAVYDFYEKEQDQGIVSALKALEAFLNGDEYQAVTPVFGESQKPSKRKIT